MLQRLRRPPRALNPARPAPERACVRAQVVQQGEGWYCEHDGKTYETRERRYIMRVKAADASGECFLHLFNDQARGAG